MALDPKFASSMRDGLLSKLDMEQQALLACIRECPDDKLDFKPHAKVMSFAELCQHIAMTGPFFGEIIEKGKLEMTGPPPEPPPAPGKKGDLEQLCNDLHAAFKQQIAGLGGEALARDIAFLNMGTFPAVTFVDWHVSHLIHHRGQLTMYLRTMGAKVPSIYGGSLDYPMQM